MAVVKPFPAIRPQAVRAAKIAALPYDVFTREEAKREVEKNPLSFLRVDRPEVDFPEETDMYSPQVYKKAGEYLWKLLDKGDMCQDMEACYYIYELDNGHHVQTGIAACVSVDDYLNHVVKCHENTRPEKEADRIRHIEACRAQTGPIYLAHRPDPELRRLVDIRKRSYPTYNFLAEDGVRHRVWVIYQRNVVEKIQQLFSRMGSIYIADGHHRAAAAVKIAKKRREQDPMYTGKEPFNYFLSVLFPWDELQIIEYNRVVRDLGGKSPEVFLNETGKYFFVEKRGASPVKPEEKGTFGLYVGKSWYLLRIKEGCRSADPVKGLDVSILQDYLLDPVLGIKNPKEDPRLQFEGGVKSLQELEKEADQTEGAAFTLYPTHMEELIKVADEGRLMPPKSTWFEPKLRSGLFIHRI